MAEMGNSTEVSSENLKGKGHLEDLCTCGRIILKLIIRK
jgi:hypothetical protein